MAGLVGVASQWFLAEHVTPCAQRGNGHRRVQEVGCADVDAIHFFVLEHLRQILVGALETVLILKLVPLDRVLFD